MEGAAAFLGSITPLTWLAFCGGSVIPTLSAWYPYARRGYYRRKLENRLLRDAYILPDERAEYEGKIDSDLPEVEPQKLLVGGMFNGLIAGMGVWSFDGDVSKEHGLMAATIALILGAGYTFWSKVNAPLDRDNPVGLTGEQSPREWTVPRDAIAGFAAALGFIACIAAMIIFFNTLW